MPNQEKHNDSRKPTGFEKLDRTDENTDTCIVIDETRPMSQGVTRRPNRDKEAPLTSH